MNKTPKKPNSSVVSFGVVVHKPHKITITVAAMINGQRKQVARSFDTSIANGEYEPYLLAEQLRAEDMIDPEGVKQLHMVLTELLDEDENSEATDA